MPDARRARHERVSSALAALDDDQLTGLLRAAPLGAPGVGGGTDSFTLLHHWRILPGRTSLPPEHRDIEALLAEFGGDPAVRTRFEELAGARASLVLLIEHLPSPLHERLADIVSVAASPRFDLSTAEREFVARHREHDADYAAMRLVNWLVTTACGVPVSSSEGISTRDDLVRRCADGDIPQDIPAPVAGILARRSPAAAAMIDVPRRLFAGDHEARYPGAVT